MKTMAIHKTKWLLPSTVAIAALVALPTAHHAYADILTPEPPCKPQSVRKAPNSNGKWCQTCNKHGKWGGVYICKDKKNVDLPDLLSVEL